MYALVEKVGKKSKEVFAQSVTHLKSDPSSEVVYKNSTRSSCFHRKTFVFFPLDSEEQLLL